MLATLFTQFLPIPTPLLTCDVPFGHCVFSNLWLYYNDHLICVCVGLSSCLCFYRLLIARLCRICVYILSGCTRAAGALLPGGTEPGGTRTCGRNRSNSRGGNVETHARSMLAAGWWPKDSESQSQSQSEL